MPQEEVTVSDSKPSDSGAVTPDLSLEEIKKTDVVEQIISEAEEKAFKEKRLADFIDIVYNLLISYSGGFGYVRQEYIIHWNMPDYIKKM